MRLKKVTQNDPVERLTVSVKKSTQDRLEAYRAHYERTYGEPIERSHLVEQVLLDYMTGDKDFMKQLSKSEGADTSAQTAG